MEPLMDGAQGTQRVQGASLVCLFTHSSPLLTAWTVNHYTGSRTDRKTGTFYLERKTDIKHTSTSPVGSHCKISYMKEHTQ